MRKLILAMFALAAVLIPALPASARGHHSHGGIYLNFGYGGYYPPYYPAYYRYPYPYHGYSYYAPPVAYAPPAYPAYAPPLRADQASPTYVDDAGRTCREYQSTVKIGGVRQPSYGTACLQPDGTWRIVD